MQTSPASSFEQLFRILDGVSEAAVFTTDLDGNVLLWPQSAASTLGYSDGDVIGRPAADLYDTESSLTSEHRPGTDGHSPRLCRHKDGAYVSLTGVVKPLHSPDGTHCGYAHVLKRTDGAGHSPGQHSAEEDIRSAQHACSLQIAEAHRSFKDSLQAAAALVDISTAPFGDAVPRNRVKRISRNIQALAALHDLATRQPPDQQMRRSVPAQGVIEVLETVLRDAAGARELQFEIDPVRLSLKTAGAISVVLNELVSYGAARGDGAITVAIHEVGGKLQVSVSHERPLTPKSAHTPAPKRVDMELLDALVRIDLAGTVHLREPGGCDDVTISVPAAMGGGAAY